MTKNHTSITTASHTSITRASVLQHIGLHTMCLSVSKMLFLSPIIAIHWASLVAQW